MEHSPHWEANSRSVSQDSLSFTKPESSLLCSQELATGSYPSSYNPVHIHRPCFLKTILILSCHLRLCLPCRLFPSSIATKTVYAFLISFTRATYPAYLTLLDLLTSIGSYLAKSTNYEVLGNHFRKLKICCAITQFTLCLQVKLMTRYI
jgi:hypothetical protein